MIQIDQALADKNLLGALPCFADLSSWAPWLVLLRAAYGLPLTAEEVEIFRAHTGRTTYAPPVGGWGEIAVVVGRQSGKTRVAAAVAIYEAITAPQNPGDGDSYALLVAQEHRAAQRALLAYVSEALNASELLRSSVEEELRESVALKSGVRIAAYPCRPASVRGLRARVVVCDELAFYRSSEGYPTDLEMLRAVRPTLATTGGKLVVISSPYGQTGALWDLHRRHYGRDGARVLVWQASAPEMNPTLSADYLERMAEEDPEGYRAEVLGEFRAGTATLLDRRALDAWVAATPWSCLLSRIGPITPSWTRAEHAPTPSHWPSATRRTKRSSSTSSAPGRLHSTRRASLPRSPGFCVPTGCTRWSAIATAASSRASSSGRTGSATTSRTTPSRTST